jgi:hypothetical protein
MVAGRSQLPTRRHGIVGNHRIELSKYLNYNANCRTIGPSILAGVDVAPSVGEAANAPIGVADAYAEELRKLIRVKINNLYNLHRHDGVSRMVCAARHFLEFRSEITRRKTIYPSAILAGALQHNPWHLNALG